MDGTEQPNNTNGSWQFTPNDQPAVATVPTAPRSVATPPAGPEGTITWTASEFVAHDKTSGWYGILAGAAFVAAVIVWFITKDLVSSIVIVVAAAAFGAMAARQPRELTYRLDSSGVQIGAKHFHYGDFRSFSIVDEGAFSSIAFMPLKRFAPLTTIYFDPVDEPKIVALLSARLPLEARKRDPIDNLMWRIRF